MGEMDQATKQTFILGWQSNMSCRRRGGVKDSHHTHKIWDGAVPLECQPHPNSPPLTSQTGTGTSSWTNPRRH